MRIGKPARKHGIADVDIWHAVRNSPRWMVLDNDLTMLIGPGTDGALLEIGVPRNRWGRPGGYPRYAVTSEVLPVPGVRKGDHDAIYR
ncbi:MAG: hypothetical protein ACYDEY_13385 [Acidimicrobiales bacterium]